MLADHFFEHVPHDRLAAFDHALGALDVLGHLGLDEPLHDEGLEELERHHLGQAALVQLELGAHHDDRTSRVVDALAEQVLTEPALLALQHVRKALERTSALARHGAATAAVVEQRVHGLLEHALLVVDDDVRCAEVEQALQAVVAVDDATVEVVQVAGREAATVELHHRAQVRRDDGNRLEDHGARIVQASTLVVATVEGLHDRQALQELGVTLRAQRLAAVLRVDHLAHHELFLVEVHPVDQLEDRVGAHATLEVLAVAEVHLAVQHLVLDDLARVERLEGVEGLAGQFALLGEARTHSVELLLGAALEGAKL